MLKLSNVFSDHAVLQRGMPIPVWGWGAPHQVIHAELSNGASAAGICGDDGNFQIAFPPQSAGGPFTLTVRMNEVTEVRSDLYIGEVWLAGGQSNMEMPLIGFLPDLPVTELDQLAFSSPVRMLTVPHSADACRNVHVDAEWTLPEGDYQKKWSAVGTFFAEKLSRELKVPVGIIASNWGGTIAEAWTSRSTLLENPDFTDAVLDYQKIVNHPECWSAYRTLSEEQLVELNAEERQIRQALVGKIPEIDENRGEAENWHAVGCDENAWRPIALPGAWQIGLNMPDSGVMWFRRTIEIPREWAGRALKLAIGSVDKQDVTYFNGVRVGETGHGFETRYWNVPRVYDVPACLVEAGRAVIAVRAWSCIYEGGLIGPANAMQLSPADAPQEKIALSGEWLCRMEANFGNTRNLAMGTNNPNSYHILYDNMIRPLLPYAVRGAIWYQGESNANAPQRYQRLMTDLIRDWKHSWGQTEFAFLQVLLAGWLGETGEGKYWPEIREAQIASAEAAGTGYASAVDRGDQLDIHPLRKRDVGKRLALRALSDVYALPVEGRGPTALSAAVRGDELVVRFAHAGGLKSVDGAPAGWEVAGADGFFYPAQARIEAEQVAVRASEVPQPRFVRYAWLDCPDAANCYNAADLPMTPFRLEAGR